jgi:hypothetical protein
MTQGLNQAPFINGAYAVTLIFLASVTLLTFLRYRRAAKRLKAIDARP